MSEPLRFSGVMPANILPFTADLAIDEGAYRRHLRWLADTRGVTGIEEPAMNAKPSSFACLYIRCARSHEYERCLSQNTGTERLLLRKTSMMRS